jgi:hypothetical protein
VEFHSETAAMDFAMTSCNEPIDYAKSRRHSPDLPRQFPTLLHCSADSLFLANHFILFSTNDVRSSWVNGLLRLLLELKMLEDISANDILVKADPFFTERVQVAASINTGFQIGLKLLA